MQLLSRLRALWPWGRRAHALWGGGLALVLLPTVAYAQTDSTILQSVALFLSLLINLMTFLALKLIELGGSLMGTEYLTGEAAMEGIRPMWVVIRNLTNVGFVLLMVVLAFTNLFAGIGIAGESKWTIKDMLPKVILSMIAINFSLLGFRVIIDAVHVVTIAVISVADTAIEAKGAADVGDMLSFATDVNGDPCYSPEPQRSTYTVDQLTAIQTNDCKTFSQWLNAHYCKADNVEAQSCWFKIDPENADSAYRGTSSTTHNLFLAFAVYFQQLQHMPALSAKLGSWLEVANDVLFSTIMAAAYVVVLGATFAALLIRTVVLWLIMVASPALIAMGILGLGDGGGDFSSADILNYLIMPIKIGLALAVSFVMMSAMADTTILSTESTFVQVGSGVFSRGSHGFIWQILTVMVFWTASFTAFKGAKFIENITDQIKSGAEQLGKFAFDVSLLDRPWFRISDPRDPTKTADASLGDLLSFPSQVDSAYRSNQRDRQRKVFADLGLFDEGANLSSASINKLDRSITDFNQGATKSQDKQKEYFNTALADVSNLDQLRSKEVQASLKNIDQSKLDKNLQSYYKTLTNPRSSDSNLKAALAGITGRNANDPFNDQIKPNETPTGPQVNTSGNSVTIKADPNSNEITINNYNDVYNQNSNDAVNAVMGSSTATQSLYTQLSNTGKLANTPMASTGVNANSSHAELVSAFGVTAPRASQNANTFTLTKGDPTNPNASKDYDMTTILAGDNANIVRDKLNAMNLDDTFNVKANFKTLLEDQNNNYFKTALTQAIGHFPNIQFSVDASGNITDVRL